MPPLPGSNITPGVARTLTRIPIHTLTVQLRVSHTRIPILTIIIRIILISIRRQASISNNRWRHPRRTHPPIIPLLSSIICSYNPPRRHPYTNSTSSTLLRDKSRRGEPLLTTEQVSNTNFFMVSRYGPCIVRYLRSYLGMTRDICRGTGTHESISTPVTSREVFSCTGMSVKVWVAGKKTSVLLRVVSAYSQFTRTNRSTWTRFE